MLILARYFMISYIIDSVKMSCAQEMWSHRPHEHATHCLNEPEAQTVRPAWYASEEGRREKVGARNDYRSYGHHYDHL